MDDLIPQDTWNDAAVGPRPGVPHLDVVHDPDLGTIAAVSVDGEIISTGVDRG